MIEKDPFLLLGYGVNAYFNTMIHLTKMFAVITLFALPIMIIYHKGGAFQGKINKLSMGNLNGATVKCN